MSAAPALHTQHPHVDLLLDGRAIVWVLPARTRFITVARLWRWHQWNVPVATICARYPVLTASQVYDALSYAYDHRAAIEAQSRAEQALTPPG